MSKVSLPIEDGFSTITRFAVKSIIEDIKTLTGFAPKDVIWKDGGVAHINAAQTGPKSGEMQLESGDYILVDYIERFSEDNTDYRHAAGQFVPIFTNHALGLRLTPIHARSVIEMNITLRSKSYNTMQEWLQRFRLNQSIRSTHNYHNLKYNYTIPDIVIAYLYDCHHLSEQVLPYGKSKKEFFDAGFTKGLVGRSNLSGSKDALCVNVESKGVLGQFGDMPDEIERERDNAYSEITFNYKLTYDKPTHLTLDYQSIIHNQRVPAEYLKAFYRNTLPVDTQQGARTFSGAVNTASEYYIKGFLNYADVFYDQYDRWHPSTPLKDTLTLFMGPIQIDLDDTHAIVDLNDLVDLGLSPTILAIMEMYHTDIHNPYAAPFLVELFAVDEVVEMVPLDIDSSLVVRAKPQADIFPRQRHYLRVSMLLDISRMSEDAQVLLRKDPPTALNLLQFWLPELTLDGTPGNLKTLGLPGESNYIISKPSWVEVLKLIPTVSETYKRYYNFQAYLVQQTNLLSRNR